jgi:hypothetical protein
LKDCALIQEQIAWDRELPEQLQLHVLSCTDCNRVATEFASLNSWVAEQFDASIPEGFADRVMARIASQSRSNRIFSSVWMQTAIVAAGCVIAVLHLIRFVLVAVVPVLT